MLVGEIGHRRTDSALPDAAEMAAPIMVSGRRMLVFAGEDAIGTGGRNGSWRSR